MKSLTIVFSKSSFGAKKYEYLIPDGLFDYVSVGDAVMCGSGRAIVEHKNNKASPIANKYIDGLLAGAEECTQCQKEFDEGLMRCNLEAKKKTLVAQMEALTAQLEALSKK